MLVVKVDETERGRGRDEETRGRGKGMGLGADVVIGAPRSGGGEVCPVEAEPNEEEELGLPNWFGGRGSES